MVEVLVLLPFSAAWNPCGDPCWAQEWEGPSCGVLDLILCKPVMLPKLGFRMSPDSLLRAVAVETVC